MSRRDEAGWPASRRRLGDREHVEQRLLVAAPRSATTPRNDAEQHDRRHDVVGQRVERDSTGCRARRGRTARAGLEQRRAEERRRLHVGGSISGKQRGRPASAMRPEQPAAPRRRAAPRRLTACGKAERAQPGDERHHHVGQHRHLEELDVARRRPHSGCRRGRQ